MSFSSNVREDALVLCGRHCSLCHKFCGLNIELHHIVQKAEGGADTLENCIPLCFECHADMRSYDHKHPKGTKYTPEELRRHRDSWYEKVKGGPGISYSHDSREQDATTYRWLVGILRYEGVMSYVEAQDFGAPFLIKQLDPLDEFLYASRDPSREFLDAYLEGLKGQLVDAIRAFLHYMSTHTWPMDKSEYQAVPREWEDRQPKRFIEVIDKLNDLSRDITTAYSALVREARRRLGV